MQKTVNIVWKMALVIILGLTLFKASTLYSKRDELVTSKIAMEYFVETVNLNNEERNVIREKERKKKEICMWRQQQLLLHSAQRKIY